MRLFIKARAVPVGTISTHGGRKMKKTPQGWVPVKSSNMRTLSDEAYIDSIINMFKRQPMGKGGPKSIKSKRDLDIVLTKTKVAFVSAGRNPEIPADVKLSDADISARDESLKSDLKQLGYLYTPALGKYGGLPENSLIVMAHGADSADMTRLGTKYNQDSVLTVNNGHSELVMTTGDQKGQVTMAGDGYEMVPAADDFFTEIEVGGKSLKFTMMLDEIKKAITRMRYFIKAKKMPIGTVSRGRKKVAEGKWVPVKKGTSGKKKPAAKKKKKPAEKRDYRKEAVEGGPVKSKIFKDFANSDNNKNPDMMGHYSARRLVLESDFKLRKHVDNPKAMALIKHVLPTDADDWQIVNRMSGKDVGMVAHVARYLDRQTPFELLSYVSYREGYVKSPLYQLLEYAAYKKNKKEYTESQIKSYTFFGMDEKEAREKIELWAGKVKDPVKKAYSKIWGGKKK